MTSSDEPDIKRFIRDIPELAEISGDVWEASLARSSILSLPAATRLIQCGDTAENFVVLLQGVVRVYEVAENGREICLYRIYRGQICVLTLTKLLLGPVGCAQAVAEEDVRLLAIPRESFFKLMSTTEDFRRLVVNSMAMSLNEIMHLVEQVSFRRLDLRLACFIGRMSERIATRRLKLTHQDVANELGTTREVVSRLLKEYENMGYIKLKRGYIEILAPEPMRGIPT